MKTTTNEKREKKSGNLVIDKRNLIVKFQERSGIIRTLLYVSKDTEDANEMKMSLDEMLRL
jgi:hypothetical protein